MKEISDGFISRVIKNWLAQYAAPAYVRKRLLLSAEYLTFTHPLFTLTSLSIYNIFPQNLSHLLFKWEPPSQAVRVQMEAPYFLLTWKRHFVC